MRSTLLLLPLCVCWFVAGVSLTAQENSQFLYDEGQIAILKYGGSSYDKRTAEGIPNFGARMRVTEEFIRTHGDLYDFIVVFTTFDFCRDGADGFYTGVRNDTMGIGEDYFDFGGEFGSASRLQGVIDMGPIFRYRRGPFSVDPADPQFRATMGLLAHELGHRWLAQVRFRASSGEVSADLLGRDGNHWSYLLSSDGSLFYGSRWEPNGDGTFTSVEVRSRYSALDLYLMGFLDAKEVPPMILLQSPADPNGYPALDDRIPGIPDIIHIEQIMDIEGPRLPGVASSQKVFNLAFILLTRGDTLPPDEVVSVEAIRANFMAHYLTLTSGRARVDADLVPATVSAPAALTDSQ